MSAPKLRIDKAALDALAPHQVDLLSDLLREYEASAKSNPLQLYSPNSEAYAEWHASKARLRALFGGNRSGKTTTSIVDDVIQVLPDELVPEHLAAYKRYQCPCFVRIVTPDMQRTMKPVIHEQLRRWIPPGLFRAGSWDKSYDRVAECLRLECGCRFDFLSHEMRLDKFGGAALHRVHYDEEPPEDIRRECVLRLVDYGGDEVFSMTPLQGLSWTYARLWVNRDRYPERLFVRKVSIYDNPHLSRDAIEAARAELVEEGLDEGEIRRRFHGDFVHMGGMVYPTFAEARAQPLDTKQLRERAIVVGIDPGVRVAAMVWVAFAQDGHAHVFDEAIVTDGQVADYARVIAQVNEKWGIQRPSYVVDPAARQRSQLNAETVASEMERVGIFAAWGQNDVEGGVMHVRRRLAMGMLAVSSTLRGLLAEAESYRVEERADGRFAVIKENDHRLDAMRYALMHRPWIPEVRARPADPWGGDPGAYARAPQEFYGRKRVDHIMGSLV